MNFERELAALLNKYNKENLSNTPDFILAAYLTKCLETWNTLIPARDALYGFVTHVTANNVMKDPLPPIITPYREGPEEWPRDSKAWP